MIGSPEEEEGRDRGEKVHMVQIEHNYFIALTEVTQRQYRAVMGALPCVQAATGDDLPVQGVMWDEAVAFCKKLSESDGRTYRLPTEAEWEVACRAGTRSPFAGSGRLDPMGWYQATSRGLPHPVSGKNPNHWGLSDMHGNVREWCSDPWDPLPTAVRNNPLSPSSIFRLTRGGSWKQTGQPVPAPPPATPAAAKCATSRSACASSASRSLTAARRKNDILTFFSRGARPRRLRY